MNNELLIRTLGVCALVAAGGCARDPILWVDDGGADAVIDAPADAGRDGALDGGADAVSADAQVDGGDLDPSCPCASLCVALEASPGFVTNIVAVGPSEAWYTRRTGPGYEGRVHHFVGGTETSVALPSGWSAPTSIAGGERPWVAARRGTTTIEHALFQWSGDGWSERPVPAAEGRHREGVTLHVALRGDVLYAAFVGGPELWVWRDDEWQIERLFETGNVVSIDANETVLAVTLADGIDSGQHTHAVRFGSGAWQLLPDHAESRTSVARVVGRFVAIGGWLVGEGEEHAAPGMTPVLAAGSYLDVPHVITPSAVYVFDDLDAPEARAHGVASPSAAAFATGSPPWLAGASLFTWTGSSAMLRLARDAPAFVWPSTIEGSPDDLWVADVAQGVSASLHRLRHGVVEDFAEPAHRVLDMVQTEDGEIWAVNGIGLHRVRTGSVVQFFANPEDEVLGHVTAGGSDVWVAGHNELYRVSGGGLVHERAFDLDPPHPVGRAAMVAALDADASGELWVVTIDGRVHSFAGGSWTELPAVTDPRMPERALSDSTWRLRASLITEAAGSYRGIYRHGGRAWIIARSEALAASAIMEWDGARWTAHELPYDVTDLVGHGGDVQAYTGSTYQEHRALVRWRRTGPGAWERDASCEGVRGAIGYWPAGESAPWFFGRNGLVLRGTSGE